MSSLVGTKTMAMTISTENGDRLIAGAEQFCVTPGEYLDFCLDRYFSNKPSNVKRKVKRAKLADLEARSAEISVMMSKGVLQKDIAKKLGCSNGLVSTYVRNLRAKNGQD